MRSGQFNAWVARWFFIELLLNTGARGAEVVKMRAWHFEESRGLVWFWGGKGRREDFREPVAVSHDFGKSWALYCQYLNISRIPEHDALMFPFWGTTRTLWNQFSRILDFCGVERRDRGLHAFRRTFANATRKTVRTVYEYKVQMRHSPNTPEDCYLGVDIDDVRQAVVGGLPFEEYPPLKSVAPLEPIIRQTLGGILSPPDLQEWSEQQLRELSLSIISMGADDRDKLLREMYMMLVRDGKIKETPYHNARIRSISKKLGSPPRLLKEFEKIEREGG